MQTLTAYRLMIQFDHPEGDPRPADAILAARLAEFTDALQRAFPEAQPSLRTDSEDFDPEQDVITDALIPGED